MQQLLESGSKKPKAYKIMSEAQLKKEATKLSEDKNRYVADVGKAILKVLVKGVDVLSDLLAKVNVVIFMAPLSLAFILTVTISCILYLTLMAPPIVIGIALTQQKKFLKKTLKNLDEPTKQYFCAIDDIANDRYIIVEESFNSHSFSPTVESVTNWDMVLEAPKEDDEPTDYTKEVDDEDENDKPTDYTEEVKTDDEPETEDKGESTDEPTDYTEEVDAQNDEPEEDTTDEPTDYTEEVDNDNTDDGEEVTTDGEVETEDTGESTDEPTDYTEEVDNDNTDEEPEEDGTEDDTTDEETTDDTNADSTNGENTIVKNYNLLVDFQSMHKTIGEILDSLHDIVYPQPIQNQVLTKGINNLQEIKSQIERYINYSFSEDYKKNVYYYTVYLQASKMNLEMLRKNYQLDKE